MDDSLLVWQKPDIVRWSQILANSYQQLLGYSLIDPTLEPEILSQKLFNAPFVVISHGIEIDPIFNYGNKTALELWSIGWDELLQTPSRQSAEPVNQTTRAAMLEQVTTKGYVENYRGTRISRTGKKFIISDVVIWNLTDESGHKCGQAATFANWQWL